MEHRNGHSEADNRLISSSQSVVKNTGILLVAAGLYKVSMINGVPVPIKYGLRAASFGVGLYGFNQSCKEAYGTT